MHPFIPLIIVTLLTWSCFEEDQPVPPYPGEVTTITDSVQTHHSYFDFETNRVVASHRSDAWQLGFECGADGWHILTNSGASWFMYNTGQTAFDVVTTMPASVKGLFDVQHAYPDSTVAGNWVQFPEGIPLYTHTVYLIGQYLYGHYTSMCQVTFFEVTDTSYGFFFKEKSGLSDTVTIVKNDLVNFVYYSFKNHTQVNLEPDKSTYDIVFTPYYDLATLFGVTIPYLVGGTFQNTFQTEAVLDSLNAFADINATHVPEYNFSNQRDIPGYRWKGVTVDVSGGVATYAVKEHYNYVFHTSEDNYFKLKFLSYTLDGKSGFPQFEFRPLE